jgi:hypothetical protein
MKNFFGIEKAYEFEWNDVRALITLINVLLIMHFGLSISWFGLAIAVFGLVKDLTGRRHINGIVMHGAGILLNLHFLHMYFCGI